MQAIVNTFSETFSVDPSLMNAQVERALPLSRSAEATYAMFERHVTLLWRGQRGLPKGLEELIYEDDYNSFRHQIMAHLLK